MHPTTTARVAQIFVGQEGLEFMESCRMIIMLPLISSCTYWNVRVRCKIAVLSDNSHAYKVEKGSILVQFTRVTGTGEVLIFTSYQESSGLR